MQKAQGEIILFIDELHTVVGAGAAQGAVDASNMLKPALARGELRCIGATTLDEYRQHIEKDSALERRFAPIYVDEPSVEDTIEILRGVRDRYEKHHQVTFTDEALVAAAKLSHRYVTDRHLPDKAIDLMDEAGAGLRVALFTQPAPLKDAKRRLAQLKIDEDKAYADNDFAGAAVLKSDRLKLAGQYEADVAWLAHVVRAGRSGRGIRHRGRRGALDRHPGQHHAGGRDRQAAAHGGGAAPAHRRPGRGHHGGRRRAAPCPQRAEEPQAAHRQLHLPGLQRRGQDRAGEGAGRVPV